MRHQKLISGKRLTLFFAILMFSGINSLGYGEIMSSSNLTSSSPQTIEEARTQAYGTKPTLAVIEFENKTGVNYARGHGARDLFGGGLKEQLVSALAQTNAFILVERQAIKDVMVEQDFGASGRVKGETASAIGEIEGANFLIYGAITEFEGGQGGAKGGFGGFGGWKSRLAGAVAGAFKQDHIAIDLRIVDSKTGRILNATSVEGKSRDFEAGFGGMFGNTLGGISGHYKNPLQKAVRACMIKAVNWIGDNLMGKSAHAGTQPAQANTQTVAQPVSATNQPQSKQQSSGGLEERLMTLKRLKDKGLITEEEYKNKKQEVLKEY